MIDFLVTHWDWLVAALGGHVVLAPVSSAVTKVVTWVKTKVAQVEAISASIDGKAFPIVQAAAPSPLPSAPGAPVPVAGVPAVQ